MTKKVKKVFWAATGYPLVLGTSKDCSA